MAVVQHAGFQGWAQMDREVLLLARDCLQIVVLEEEEERDFMRDRRWWVRDWLSRRPVHGQYDALLHELRLEDPASYRNFLRVDHETFLMLLHRLEGNLTKMTTRCRAPVTPALKLALTLRYLATGSSYRSLMYGFRVAHNTISGIVADVCQAIVDVFEAEVIQTPTEPQQWLEVAEQFQNKWQFPHALGALDGKHIAITKPQNSGSTYHNYKGFFSVVLLALVDADYKFRWIQVGDVGSSSDAQIWNHCDLREGIDQGVVGIPDPAPLPGDDQDTPYFILADDAFALQLWLMKPYSKRGLSDLQKIFNYRLSRGRRVVENGFGILANRFRCLLTTLNQRPDRACLVIKACVCLHNLLRSRNPAADNAIIDNEDQDHHVVPGAWRQHCQMHDMDNLQRGNLHTRAAKRQRDYLMHYVNSPAGSVAWQDRMLRQY